jgi:putative membrane protein
MMDGYNNWGMGYGFGFGWIIGLIILVLIIVLILKVVNQKNKLNQTDIKSSHDVLKHRYSKGEISKAEFEGKKKIFQLNKLSFILNLKTIL